MNDYNLYAKLLTFFDLCKRLRYFFTKKMIRYCKNYSNFASTNE